MGIIHTTAQPSTLHQFSILALKMPNEGKD